MAKKIMNLSELQYTKYADTMCPVMLINGDIGDGPGEINGRQFADELYALDEAGVGCVKIYINSMGGSVADGMSIFDAILKVNLRVITYCSGMCHSIAAIIWLAGDERYCSDYGSLMYHNPFNASGEPDQGLDVIRKCLLVMVEARSDFNIDDVETLMNMETWMMADQAKSMGLSDDTIMTPKKINNLVTSETQYKNKWSLSNLYLNKFIENDKTKEMKNIKNSASDNDVTKKTSGEKAITPDVKPDSLKVINPAKPNMLDSTSDDVEEAEDELEDAKQALIEAQAGQLEDDEDVDDKSEKVVDCAATGDSGKDVAPNAGTATVGASGDKKNQAGDVLDPAEIITDESDMDEVMDLKKQIMDLNQTIEKLTADTESYKSAQKSFDKSVMDKRAEIMVDSYVKTGKIKNEVREKYLNLAKSDYKSTKELLDTFTTISKPNNVVVDKTSSLKPTDYVGEVLAKARQKAENKANSYKNRKSNK